MESSPDTDEVPPFTEKEIEHALKKMRKMKAPGNDGITSDIIKMGGQNTIAYITKAFNNILYSQQIPECWQEAKIIILHKKGDRRDIKNYRPISLLSHTYKLFTRVLQDRMEKVLDENQP